MKDALTTIRDHLSATDAGPVTRHLKAEGAIERSIEIFIEESETLLERRDEESNPIVRSRCEMAAHTYRAAGEILRDELLRTINR